MGWRGFCLVAVGQASGDAALKRRSSTVRDMFISRRCIHLVGLKWWDSCGGTYMVGLMWWGHGQFLSGALGGNSFIFYVVAYVCCGLRCRSFAGARVRDTRPSQRARGTGHPLHWWRQRESKARGTRRSSVIGCQSSGKAHGADSVLTHSNVAQNATLEWGTVGPANRTSKPGPPAYLYRSLGRGNTVYGSRTAV